MPKVNLKLGHDMEDGLVKVSDMPNKYYPTFRVESDEKPELPHEGTMTIKFRKVASEMREDNDGDEHYSCTIEVHEIVDAYSSEPEAPAKSHSKETENALDELKAKRKSKSDAY